MVLVSQSHLAHLEGVWESHQLPFGSLRGQRLLGILCTEIQETDLNFCWEETE